MIEAMADFLYYYQRDNLPLNIALAATIIYFDLEEGDKHRGEGFIDSGSPKTSLMKKGSLSEFVLYFPHMLRFVETNHLTAFIHPTRFATMHYSHDTLKKTGGLYKIDSSCGVLNGNILNETRMRSLYLKIRSRHPQVSTYFRFTLIPASMPGTSMVFPQDCSHVEKPTSDLHTLCCLNDVRTMGHPDYFEDVDRVSGLRSVGGPKWAFSEAMEEPFSRLDGVPSISYWKPIPSNGVKALTGVAKTIGPIFPHVGSSCYKDEYITECFKRYFGMLEFFTKNFNISKNLPDYIFKDIQTKAKGLRKVLTYLGKKRSTWSFDLETLTPSWKGMGNDLKSLHEKGELEQVASGSLKRAAPEEHPTSAPKRVKLAKRCLSSVLRARILGIVGDLAVRSLGWYPLRQYLESATNPSLNEAWDLLSEVESFKSEMLETLPAEDADNGDKIMDKAIRICFRAAGLFNWPQAKSLDYEQHWDKYREDFSRVDKTTAGILNTFYKYRNTDGAFEDFLPMIGLMRESSMIRGQVDACTQIEGLLETARTIVKIRTPRKIVRPNSEDLPS
ncbi:polyketide synthase [Fusarium agapanthi]|uniref:Polyketide synthase n=1 Tax=Fusarium agapanthi TaxID=1803897 RepID=A0A9P5EC88_9HYPO|nr:polyketide synthase [Fusarium agapanthi]